MEMVGVRKLHGPLQTQSSVRNRPSSKPSGGRCASWPHLAGSCSGSRFTDANLAARQCLAKPSPFPTLSTFSTQPHCHNHATPLHLHLVTHYLDHLWSSPRLESLALSLHSFKSCILIHVYSS